MGESAPRGAVRFVSGDTRCAAWHYPGTNGACVIMAGGFALAKEPATDLFASRFHQAGFTVLAFDYRRIGESGGQPRQVLPIADQLADWQAAIAFASTLPGVDPTRLAVWGFSTTGGHLLRVAAATPRLAAAIAQTPNVGGLAATRNASAYQRPAAMLRFTLRGIFDALGGLLGRRPLLVPLVGQPGTVAMLTTPDALDSDRALNPDNAYPDWPPTAAARSALRLAFYRPGRVTSRIQCPLLVLVCDQDQTTLAASSVRAARRAPDAELVRLPGGHYAPFLEEHERAVQAELSFLRRHLIEPPRAEHGEHAAGSARN
jgi:pimeloyl-ACP methyl ester carboxylesterase